MNLSIIQYNRKPDPMFCAQNSLYLQVNSMINAYNKNDTFKEFITLDDISTRIGFKKSMGSLLNREHLSKLSNRVNKLKSIYKLNIPNSTLVMLDNTQFLSKISKPKENKIFTICLSSEQYFKFVTNRNYFSDYYQNSEKIKNSALQHCIALIVQIFNEIPKYIIIDPNIELSNQNIAMDISEMTTKYDNKIISVEWNDIKTLLTMRYDSMDDDRIIVDMEFEKNSSLDIY